MDRAGSRRPISRGGGPCGRSSSPPQETERGHGGVDDAGLRREGSRTRGGRHGRERADPGLRTPDLAELDKDAAGSEVGPPCPDPIWIGGRQRRGASGRSWSGLGFAGWGIRGGSGPAGPSGSRPQRGGGGLRGRSPVGGGVLSFFFCFLLLFLFYFFTVFI